ncbi:uncharacterized protein LOC116548824 [Sapajus apella]|uniref:Uncharacterized protein LOC116548824 n=1 Tax=Sapajus apella TaxID=9515 RepID=A0A6J3HJF4_SAPAP|nr:uncharacterized protein LOC116548824 [Sapajus apella]
MALGKGLRTVVRPWSNRDGLPRREPEESLRTPESPTRGLVGSLTNLIPRMFRKELTDFRDWLCVPRPFTPPRLESSRDWLSSATSPGMGCVPRPRPDLPGIGCAPRSPPLSAPPRAASPVCAPGAGLRPLCPLELCGRTRHYFVADLRWATCAAAGTQARPTLSSRSSSLLRLRKCGGLINSKG